MARVGFIWIGISVGRRRGGGYAEAITKLQSLLRVTLAGLAYMRLTLVFHIGFQASEQHHGEPAACRVLILSSLTAY